MHIHMYMYVSLCKHYHLFYQDSSMRHNKPSALTRYGNSIPGDCQQGVERKIWSLLTYEACFGICWSYAGTQGVLREGSLNKGVALALRAEMRLGTAQLQL